MAWNTMESCPYGALDLLIFEGGIYVDDDGDPLINEVSIGFAARDGTITIRDAFFIKFIEPPVGWQYAPEPSKTGARYIAAKTHGKPFLSIVT